MEDLPHIGMMSLIMAAYDWLLRGLDVLTYVTLFRVGQAEIRAAQWRCDMYKNRSSIQSYLLASRFSPPPLELNSKQEYNG